MPRGVVSVNQPLPRRAIEQANRDGVRLRRFLLGGGSADALQRRPQSGALGPVGDGAATRLAHRFLR